MSSRPSQAAWMASGLSS
uniref:Uncharacterized protein n=1 Tax=Arundo donax TaxID=35708 RepID=A0A0A9BAZ4_ARUDO